MICFVPDDYIEFLMVDPERATVQAFQCVSDPSTSMKKLTNAWSQHIDMFRGHRLLKNIGGSLQAQGSFCGPSSDQFLFAFGWHQTRRVIGDENMWYFFLPAMMSGDSISSILHVAWMFFHTNLFVESKPSVCLSWVIFHGNWGQMRIGVQENDSTRLLDFLAATSHLIKKNPDQSFVPHIAVGFFNDTVLQHFARALEKYNTRTESSKRNWRSLALHSPNHLVCLC